MEDWIFYLIVVVVILFGLGLAGYALYTYFLKKCVSFKVGDVPEGGCKIVGDKNGKFCYQACEKGEADCDPGICAIPKTQDMICNC